MAIFEIETKTILGVLYVPGQKPSKILQQEKPLFIWAPNVQLKFSLFYLVGRKIDSNRYKAELE